MNLIGIEHPHGDIRCYWHGCRCLPCRASRAVRDRKAWQDRDAIGWLKTEARYNAGYLRRRILSLNSVGMDNPAVADAAGVPLETILDIRSGKVRQVPPSEAARIRAIEVRAFWSGRLLDVRATRRRIEYLRAEGFTPAEIVRRFEHERKSAGITVNAG